MSYKSVNSGNECTPEQYIAEIIMVRKYEKQGIKLPIRFWNIDKYKKEYVQTIVMANKFTKLYPHHIVIKVLNTTGNWITSLFVKKLNELIEIELNKENNNNKDFKLEVGDINSLPTTSSNKKTSLGRLRDE